MVELRYDHVLSYPEHIWLEFWRVFFSQHTLIFGPEQEPVRNTFLYQSDVEIENRKFDVTMIHDLKGGNVAVAPCLVIEDSPISESGLLLDQRMHWQLTPERRVTYGDLVRTSYLFHCVSSKRGESRMMAGIVWAAFHIFKEVLYEMGIHKIESASISPTQQVRAAGDEDRVDTVVQIPFWFQQTWRVAQRPNLFLDSFCFFEAQAERMSYIRSAMDVAYQSHLRYTRSRMLVSDPFDYLYVKSIMDLDDPTSSSSYVRGTETLQNPVAATRYVRAQMRVA